MFVMEIVVHTKFARRSLTLLCALALPALAQNRSDIQSRVSAALDTHFTSASGVRIFGIPVEGFRRNQPLSLILTVTTTLPDGTRVNHTPAQRLYRDSSGRLRIESFYNNGQPSVIVLLDPIAGKISYLKVVGKDGFSPAVENSRMMSSLAARVASANIKPQWPGETTEALPPKTIDGYTAEGTRRAWTVPARIQDGHNDPPVHTVLEEWFSPKLGIDLQFTAHTRAGSTTFTATGIQLKEPNPSLFQVPSDYTIANPSGPATANAKP